MDLERRAKLFATFAPSPVSPARSVDPIGCSPSSPSKHSPSPLSIQRLRLPSRLSRAAVPSTRRMDGERDDGHSLAPSPEIFFQLADVAFALIDVLLGHDDAQLFPSSRRQAIRAILSDLMPTISWNEIRHRVLQFAHEWKDAKAHREAAEKQTFWNEFFHIFGLRRRHVAAFEQPLKNVRGKYGFLDLFWPGVVLVEHKTAGASLAKAESQAFEYVRDLIRAGRQQEVPRYIVVSDFARFGIYDIEPDDHAEGEEYLYKEIPLDRLQERIREFAFIAGDKPQRLNPEDPANFDATALLAGLHDSMKDAGYAGADLERFLVRVLFCLFAEDTGIFEPLAFTNLLNSTKEDGGDLGMYLAQLFDVLNKQESARPKHLTEDLAAFPYVNGSLFEILPFAAFIEAAWGASEVRELPMGEDLARGLRQPVPGHPGQAGAASGGRALHQRARHHEGGEGTLHRRTPGGARRHHGRQVNEA